MAEPENEKDPRLVTWSVFGLAGYIWHFCYICYIRVDYIRDYALTSMRLKKEKWKKIIIQDEQRDYLNNFIDKGIFSKTSNAAEYNIASMRVQPSRSRW